jgi:hypothetical protein
MIVNNWSLDKFWAFQTNPLLLYTFIFSWWCPLFRLVDLFLPLFPWLGLWSCYIDVHMHKVWYLYVYIHNIIDIYIYTYVCVQLGNITINTVFYKIEYLPWLKSRKSLCSLLDSPEGIYLLFSFGVTGCLGKRPTGRRHQLHANDQLHAVRVTGTYLICIPLRW